MPKHYATTTSFHPPKGRAILMPAGCVGVLYVFEHREQAAGMSDDGSFLELSGDGGLGSATFTVDAKSGEMWRRDEGGD